jgi:UrcA family protein
MNRKCGTLATLTLLCATTFVAGGASAEEFKKSESVSFDSADLQTPGGAQALYRRIQSAAKRVCREPHMDDPTRYSPFRMCVELAVEGAVKQVHSPALTTLYQSKLQYSATREPH